MMKTNRKHFVVIAIASLMMGSSMGLNMNTMGVYLQPIAQSLGVTTGDISMHSTLLSIGMAIGAFLVPPILDRFNFRYVVLVATFVTAGATLAMSWATAIWMFNILGFLRGIASSFFGVVALQLLINNWFIANHGMITSLVFSFSGIAGAIFSPVLSGVIQNQDWRTAIVIHSLLFVLFNLPGILVPYHLSPQEEGIEPYGFKEAQSGKTEQGQEFSLRKPLSYKSISFIATLILGIAISSLTALNQHLAGIGIDFGFTATIGALMISACMIGNILFKFIIGIISDGAGTIVAVLLMVGTTSLGLVLVLLSRSNLMALAGSLFLGAIYSVTTVGLSLFVKHIYSDEEFPKVFPMVNFMTNIGGAIAVSAYGYSYDLSGGYELAITTSIGITVLIVFLIVIANQTSRVKNIER